MKQTEVPQDHVTYYGPHRKAVYATDGRGHYGAVASSGWQAEEAVTSDAIAEYQRLAEAARARVEQGLSAPLEYHMYARRMDEPMLAETAGIWRWRLRRHLRAEVFRGLKEKTLLRYATALGLSVVELCRLPPRP